MGGGVEFDRELCGVVTPDTELIPFGKQISFLDIIDRKSLCSMMNGRSEFFSVIANQENAENFSQTVNSLFRQHDKIENL